MSSRDRNITLPEQVIHSRPRRGVPLIPQAGRPSSGDPGMLGSRDRILPEVNVNRSALSPDTMLQMLKALGFDMSHLDPETMMKLMTGKITDVGAQSEPYEGQE